MQYITVIGLKHGFRPNYNACHGFIFGKHHDVNKNVALVLYWVTTGAKELVLP